MGVVHWKGRGEVVRGQVDKHVILGYRAHSITTGFHESGNVDDSIVDGSMVSRRKSAGTFACRVLRNIIELLHWSPRRSFRPKKSERQDRAGSALWHREQISTSSEHRQSVGLLNNTLRDFRR